MQKRHSPLFTPFKIANLEIKNRFVMCAMGGVQMYNLDGKPADNVYRYYIERARGGVGLIVSRAIIVKPIGLKIKLYEHPEIFDPMRILTDEVHKHGCKIFMQLSGGAGRTLHQRVEYFENKGISFNEAFFAPSDGEPNVWYPEIKHRGLTTEEVYDYIYTFGQMAKIAKNVGFDGVEIHAIHEGYLIDQFTVANTNHRTDEFGGSLENRFRFPCEIIKAIKDTCGTDYPVSMRYSIKSKMKAFNSGPMPGEDYEEFGRDIEESIRGAQLLQAAGCDMLSTDNGSYDSWYWPHPPVYMPNECNLPETAILKKYVSIPVVCAGKMDNPDSAAKRIKDGICDGIGIARALLTDPYFVKKVYEGNVDDIKPCIGCHNGCLGRIEHGGSNGCALNPTVLKEGLYENMPAPATIKRIAVVGGGIAGMEAALILSHRGHSVTIYERSNQLGGIFNVAAAFDFKERDKALLKWYNNAIQKSKVRVLLNTTITSENIDLLDEDEIIIACGAKPKPLWLNGEDVESAVSFISNYKAGAYKNVIVVGGGLTGCEISYTLAKDGSNVTIVDIAPEILTTKGLCSANKLFLLHAFKHYGVKVLCNSLISNIEMGKALISSTNGISTTSLSYDKIIIATGYAPNNSWGESIKGKQIHYIGDARQVGNLMTVVADAYDIAYKI